MALPTASDNIFPKLILDEAGTLGTVAAGERRLGVDANGVLVWKDSAALTSPIAARNKWDATAAPTANDDSGDGYQVGSRWIDVTNDKEYVCLDASVGAAVWTETTQSGGGGGSAWTKTVDEDGSSIANWTSVAGTWSSNGSIIQQTDTSASNLNLRYTSAIPTAQMIIEGEIRWPTSGQATPANYAGFHVGAGDLRNALGEGPVELQRNTEGDRRQDSQLVRGIDAFHVETRVGLGVTQALRLGQHVGEVRTLVPHFGKNEIAGAIDDAGQPLDAVTGQAFANGLDDRNAAGDSGLERHHHPILLRGREDLVAVRCDQRLVGRDHVLAVGDRLQHQRTRRLIATHEFNDHGEVRVVDHVLGFVGETDPRGRAIALAFRVAGRGVHDLDRTAGAALNFIGVARQHIDRAAADGAETENTYLDGFHVCPLPVLNGVIE